MDCVLKGESGRKKRVLATVNLNLGYFPFIHVFFNYKMFFIWMCYGVVCKERLDNNDNFK
jgi:hypothetical protein